MKNKKHIIKGRSAPVAKRPLATEQVNLRITPELLAYLREKAVADGRTASGLIIFLCEQYRRANPLE
jgi:hypothetical protein